MSPAVLPDFSSAEVKLRHASLRVNEFRARTDAWVNANVEHRWRRPEASQLLLDVRLTTPPPLMEWAALAGEGVQALRDALDHGVYAIAWAKHGDKVKDERSLSFPIRREQAEWSKAAKNLAKFVSVEVVNVALEAQPWHSQRPVLKWLVELSNKAKHRSLELLTTTRASTSIELQMKQTVPGPGLFLVPTGPLEAGPWKTVGGLLNDRPLPDELLGGIEYEIIQVFHDVSDINETQDAHVVLAEIAHEVERVVANLRTATY